MADCETCGRTSQVDHYQPYYTFNSKHMTDLRIGAVILQEAIHLTEKGEDERLKLKMLKAEEEIRIKRVCSLRHEKPTHGIQLYSRQRKPSWMIAKSRSAALNGNERSGIKGRATHLTHPRCEQMSGSSYCLQVGIGRPPGCSCITRQAIAKTWVKCMHYQPLYTMPIAM